MRKIVSLIRELFSVSKVPAGYVEFFNAHNGEIDIEH